MADWAGRHRTAFVAVLAVFALACALLVAQSRAEMHRAGPVDTSSEPAHVGPEAGLGDSGTSPRVLEIPEIGVHTDLMRLGLTEQRELEVPPLRRADIAGWYRLSPAPGDPGPSVIVGHVDSGEGPAVFHRLGALERDDRVRVRRSDGRVAVFAVDRVATYDKDTFPTRRVYGSTRDPQLRLITCGGDFDADNGGWQANTVVYARLLSLSPKENRHS